MFYSFAAKCGKKVLVNLNLVQRVEIFGDSLCFVYNTPHVTGLLYENRHYKLFYFCKDADLKKAFQEIENGLTKRGLLIEPNQDPAFKRLQ